jgi:hypothetical protein
MKKYAVLETSEGRTQVVAEKLTEKQAWRAARNAREAMGRQSGHESKVEVVEQEAVDNTRADPRTHGFPHPCKN